MNKRQYNPALLEALNERKRIDNEDGLIIIEKPVPESDEEGILDPRIVKGMEEAAREMNGHTEKDFIATAFYAYSTTILAKTAQVLGKTEDADFYNHGGIRIKSIFRAARIREEIVLSSSNSANKICSVPTFSTLKSWYTRSIICCN